MSLALRIQSTMLNSMPRRSRAAGSGRTTLVAALLGFFVITLDAVVINVALPTIRADLGASMTGLQWVADGYTLMFAALLLPAGALSDRAGARSAFTGGLMLFVLASVACGLAPNLGVLIVARFVQGAGAAVMMPSSMALIGEAYPDPVMRARAVAMWAMGGAIASTSGPVAGGLLTLVSWRLIFFINVPVGVVALLLFRHWRRSPRHTRPFDWVGQVTAFMAMGGMVYGAIEAGAVGFSDPRVMTAFAGSLVAIVVFLAAQARGAHPMVPLELFRLPNVSVAVAIGFAFMACYFGLPFVISLYLQEQRGLSPLDTGMAFLPMMLIGAVLTPFSARAAERFGARGLVSSGLGMMMSSLVVIAFLPVSTPVWALSALMVPVGLAGPLVSPPTTAVLLNSVPRHHAGTASGVYNTGRQLGGALAIAVFGALLAHQNAFMNGLRTSLLIAAGVAFMAAVATVAALNRQTGATRQDRFPAVNR